MPCDITNPLLKSFYSWLDISIRLVVNTVGLSILDLDAYPGSKCIGIFGRYKQGFTHSGNITLPCGCANSQISRRTLVTHINVTHLDHYYQWVQVGAIRNHVWPNACWFYVDDNVLVYYTIMNKYSVYIVFRVSFVVIVGSGNRKALYIINPNRHRRVDHTTVKPVCNDHLYNKIYYLWFIQ